jgi:hypothetical protein
MERCKVNLTNAVTSITLDLVPKISIRLSDAEAKRINRVCKALKKKTDQNPSTSAIVKKWIFLQVAASEEVCGIQPIVEKRYGGKRIDLANLSESQQRVLLAIKELIDEGGGHMSPSFDEIGSRIGTTQSWAHRVCEELKDLGYLTWDANKHRDVRIVGEVE